MKTRYLVILIVTMALSGGIVQAQESEEKVKLPDEIMQRVVRHIVNAHFNRLSGKTQTIYFSDNLIKPEWLPKIRNKRSIVLNHTDAERSGIHFHSFHRITVEGDKFEIWFGSGSGCSLSGEIWTFRTNSNKLLISRMNGGWGSGCGSGSGSGHGISDCGGPPN